MTRMVRSYGAALCAAALLIGCGASVRESPLLGEIDAAKPDGDPFQVDAGIALTDAGCDGQFCDAGSLADAREPSEESHALDCSSGFLTRPMRDGWLGVAEVHIPPGPAHARHYCATVPDGVQLDRLRFEASDLSNRTCARAEMTVRQQNGARWHRNSGIAGGPWVSASAIVSRTERDYEQTAPGLYYITIETHRW